MARFLSRINVRRWTPPSIGFLAGYGVYHTQTREETFGQQIPLNAVRVYSSIAPWFRFLRRESERGPAGKEILRCSRIHNVASDFGICSDSLRRRLLRMEIDAGGSDGIERIEAIINGVERWRPDLLLLACEATQALPLDPRVQTLHRVLVCAASTLEKDSVKTALWTKKIFGKDAAIPIEKAFLEKVDVDRLLRQISRTQNPVVAWNFGALNLERIRWEYVLPLSALGIVVLLGQDGLGIGQYRIYDVVTITQRGGHHVTELGGRGIAALRCYIPTSVRGLPQLSQITEWVANIPFPSLPTHSAALTNICKQQIVNCRTVVQRYTALTLREADRIMEHVRSRFGRPLPPTPPQVQIE